MIETINTTPTLSDVLIRLEEISGLTHNRKRDLRSAVSSTARMLRKSPDAIPAYWPAIRTKMANVTAAEMRISEKRYQNIKSDLHKALQLTGYLHRRIAQQPRSVEWENLYQQLPTKRLKNGLSSFIRYCSDRNILPDQVNDQISQDFVQHLEEEGVRNKPTGVHRCTCKLWNDVTELFPDWPSNLLTLPDYRIRAWQMEWSEFSPQFTQDVDHYLQWLAGEDLLANHYPPHICESSTIRLRRDQLRGLASALINSGYAVDELRLLADLIDPEAAKRALTFQLSRHNNEPTVYIQGLAGTIVSIAKHWVQSSEAELEKLKTFRRRLGPRTQRGLTEKNRDMLRQLNSEEVLKRLLDLPQRIIRESHKLPSSKRKAVAIQLALAIELLTMAPMRIGNLAALRLDTHIQRIGRRKQKVIVTLAEGEVKNDVAQEFPLPTHSIELLDLYLNEHRPHLVESGSPWLFPGQNGDHKRSVTLSDQLSGIIFKKTGIRMTPHQFRHLAGKLILMQNPGAYETVRRVLGHQNLKTTTNFYSDMGSGAAVKSYDETILGLRDGK
jgi:integrase